MKKLVIGLSLFAVVFFGGVAIFLYNDFTEEPVDSSQEELQSNDNEENEELSGSNPFGDDVLAHELEDKHFQDYIHGMSHQKVKADEKWIFYELTQERVEWLLAALDEANVKNESDYRDILERWVVGDFSQAHHDHNTVWSMQGGTVGKATGLLSPEEEQAYLDKAKK